MKKIVFLLLIALNTAWAGKVTEYFGFGNCDDGKRVWYAKMYDGTVEAMFDDEGNNQGASRYSAFGKRISNVGQPVDREAFQGQDFRETPDHYNLGLRNMQEESGQWLQPEPLLIGALSELTDPLKYSPYRYSRNTPTVFSDFSGLACGAISRLDEAYYNSDSPTPQICNFDGYCIDGTADDLPSCSDVLDSADGAFCTLDWRDNATWDFFSRAVQNHCFKIEGTDGENGLNSFAYLRNLEGGGTQGRLVGFPVCSGSQMSFVPYFPPEFYIFSLSESMTLPIANDSMSDSLARLFWHKCPGLSNLGPGEYATYRVTITSRPALDYAVRRSMSCKALDDVNRYYSGLGANDRFIQALFNDLPTLPSPCNLNDFIFYVRPTFQDLKSPDGGS